MKYLIQKEPNWIYEAAACLTERYVESENKVIENHNKFGMTKDEMEGFFEKYKSYKKAVLKDISPIYTEFSSYQWLFEPLESLSEPKGSIGIGLVVTLGGKDVLELTDEDIDGIVDEYIIDLVVDYGGSEGQEVQLKGLEELVNILVDTTLHDSLKVKLIKLYSTRYETVRKMGEILYRCLPACKEHFHLIEEDYLSILKDLEGVSNLQKLFTTFVGIRLQLEQVCRLSLSIFAFNALTLELKEDEGFYFLGIYFLKLVELKDKFKVSDEDMVTTLKALSDSTRVKILRLLKERNMYLKELADRVQLTPATVSHHIDVLMQSELVSITLGEENARKVFYQLNSSRLRSIGHKIIDMALKEE